MSAKAKALTEEELLRRLRVRYNEKSGNGYTHAFIPGVRSAAAFDARRTIDAYAMSLWPSRGLALTALECKSSRSDWQRELKKPDKAEEFCELADYFYMVVGDKDIVRPGELPETWGLMVPHGTGLKIAVEAPRLRPAATETLVQPLPPAFNRSFLAALLRAACAVGQVTPAEIAEAERAARTSERELAHYQNGNYEDLYRQLDETVQEFEKAAGIRVRGYKWPKVTSSKEIGAAVKVVLEGEHDVDGVKNQMGVLRDQAQRIIDNIDRYPA